MFTVVLVGLVAVFLITAAIVIAAFLRTAFGDEQEMAKQAREQQTWRPFFLRGETLRNWAANTAQRITERRLKGERSAKTPVQLLAEIGDGADHAMLPLARQAELERIVACPKAGQGMIGVTAVEVLAIAANLRAGHSRREQQHIHDLAQANAREIAAQEGTDSQPPLPCPLQGDHQICCVYAARPLHCRPLHAIAVAQSMSARKVCFPGPEVDQPAGDGHERTVAEGIEDGLARGLKAAGFDEHTYELNSALAKALEVPDAAGRWARGENVFESCLRIERPTNGSRVSADTLHVASARTH
jgi:hypothetical protein